jgi:hypothetical protein
MGLIAAARERPFEGEELFVWTADARGVVRGAEEVFVRLCAADPAGQPLDALGDPAPVLDRPGAALTRYTAADGALFWAMVFTLPVAGGVVGVGLKPAHRGGFVDEVAARRARRVRGERAAIELRDLLGGVGVRLAAHARLAETFASKSDFVEELAEEIRLFSINAILAANRVADAAAIAAVAQLMQSRSDAAGPEIVRLREAIQDTATVLDEARFRAAAGELLAEARLLHPRAPLAAPLADTSEAAVASLGALEAALDKLARVSAAVDEHLKMLRFLELQGRIEAARAHDTEHVRALFGEIGAQVRTAGAELRDFIALGARPNRDDGRAARAARPLVAALRTAAD